MSYANLPLLWMFSGRNNVFLWATGWSFATFNVFHRHIAMIATIQAIVHSIGYTGFEFAESGVDIYKSYFAEAWWYLGVAVSMAEGLCAPYASAG